MGAAATPNWAGEGAAPTRGVVTAGVVVAATCCIIRRGAAAVVAGRVRLAAGVRCGTRTHACAAQGAHRRAGARRRRRRRAQRARQTQARRPPPRRSEQGAPWSHGRAKASAGGRGEGTACGLSVARASKEAEQHGPCRHQILSTACPGQGLGLDADSTSTCSPVAATCIEVPISSSVLLFGAVRFQPRATSVCCCYARGAGRSHANPRKVMAASHHLQSALGRWCYDRQLLAWRAWKMVCVGSRKLVLLHTAPPPTHQPPLLRLCAARPLPPTRGGAGSFCHLPHGTAN